MGSTDHSADESSKRPTLARAASISIGLSVLFVVTYSGTNWITSLRSDVGTWYYEWERFIPFVPAMIVPYMSIDLFFVVAPFLCANRLELRLLSGRISLAIVVAGVCFLLFPLTLAVERPYVDGWLGVVFNWFRELDLPYNLCPSLHIALRTILADLYVRHSSGIWRWMTYVWFSLIGLSTLLTYQHHVVDIIGGFILAAVCFYVVRETPLRLPVQCNYRVGRMYLFGTLIIAVIGIAIGGWGLLLIYPAVSTALIAGAYFGLGPGVFGKTNGRLPLNSRFLLGPVLAGQYLSLLYYRRQRRAWDEVTDRLWIGRRLTDLEADQALRSGITAVVDLTVAFSEARPLLGIPYLHIPVLDLTAPSSDQLNTALEFIDRHSTDGIVYVHCKIGYSRSAAVAAAYLLNHNLAATADDALRHLRTVRPTIVVRPEIDALLRQFT